MYKKWGEIKLIWRGFSYFYSKVNLIATFPTLPPSGRDRVRMFRVEVDFEPSDAMVERAVHRVVHRVAERDRHQHRDQDGEEDAEAHNSVIKFATNN